MSRTRKAISGFAGCALVLGALTACALAQAPSEVIREGAWNASLPAAQSVARYTGRPVLILFAEDWCGYCEELEQILAHRDLRDTTRRFILVKLEPDLNPATMRRFGVTMHHQVVMLDWSGKVAGKVIEWDVARDVALKIIEAAVANDRLAGDKLLELGYPAKAAERYQVIVKISRDKNASAYAQKKLDEIRDRGRRELDLIRQLIKADRLDDAADACTRVIEDFPPDMGATEARRILGKIRSGGRVTFGDEKPEKHEPPKDAAQRMLERGMVHEWDRELFDAVTTYQRLLKRHPDSAAAREAEKRLKLLLENETTKTLVEQQKIDKFCRRRMEMGRLYEENNRGDLAAKYYEQVVAAHPDSAYAAEARKRLEAIRTKKPDQDK